jgi:hypothetical protein
MTTAELSCPVEGMPLSDQLAVMKLVAARLEAAGIPYMVSGSTAMNYYAQPRMTRDVDVVVELSPDDVDRFTELFAGDFYCDTDAVRAAAKDRSLFNLFHLGLVIKVDFVVRKDTPYRREEFARRNGVVIDDAKIHLVTPEDLVLSKLDWAKESRSETQLEDVRNLIAFVTDLDWSYIERWAAHLTVVDLLREVRG